MPGREFSVAILKQENSPTYLVLPIEKVAPKDERGKRILSKRIKSADSVCDLVVTDKLLHAKLTTLALNVFHALGACDYGRIDIRMDKNGVPHFLEANLLPSLIDNYGSFPKACALNVNMNHETMILNIAALGLSRGNKTIFEEEASPDARELFFKQSIALDHD